MKRKIGILSITKATMQTLFNWPDAFFLPTQMNSFVLHTSLFISVQSFLVLLFFLNRCTAMEGCFFKIDYQFDISKEIFINFFWAFSCSAWKQYRFSIWRNEMKKHDLWNRLLFYCRSIDFMHKRTILTIISFFNWDSVYLIYSNDEVANKNLFLLIFYKQQASLLHTLKSDGHQCKPIHHFFCSNTISHCIVCALHTILRA